MFDSESRASGGVAVEPARPLDLLNRLAQGTPDGAAADLIGGLDPARLTDVERLDALTVLHAHLARTHAQLLDLVASLNPAGRARGDGLDGTREEISLALTLSGWHADRLLDTAHALNTRLLATRAALHAGTISFEHAAHLAHETRHLSDETARHVEAQLLALAATLTPGRFRRQAARAAAAADPTGAQQRHTRARAQRRVETRAEDDAMGSLYAYGPAIGIATIRLACDTLARRAGLHADGRTLDQRRFDALVDIARAALGQPGLPTSKGRTLQVLLHMTPQAALGLTDEPADLDGYGPIPAATARAAAADADWRAFILDAATGTLHRLGSRTYRPSTRLAEHLDLRDRTCSFPHCDIPAAHCDTEHATPHAHGGTTDPDNCAPMCRHHHRLKTHTSWIVQRNPNHTATWTSPLGQTHTPIRS